MCTTNDVASSAATIKQTPHEADNHKEKDYLIRQLIAELHLERSARVELEEEVKELRLVLAQKEKAEFDSGQREQTAVTSTTTATATLIKQPVPFRNIPIVDLSLPLADVAFEIGQACRQVGFFYVINHGMSLATISNTMAFSKRFFDLPSHIKTEVNSSNSRSGARGYFALGGEDLNAKDSTRDLAAEGQLIGSSAASFRGDWKEGFDCGREISADDDDYAKSTLVDCNHWPREEVLPGFRKAMLHYQQEIQQVGSILMEAFAVGLGLPPSFFVDRTQKPMATLRLLHYPPQPKQDVATLDRFGCGAHTDYGLCTILLQDEVGGLQVRNSAGVWVNALPIPGAFVVNIGDMMSMWSNGRYASTVHRVINMNGTNRYSIPFFLNPDVGTMVETLPTCEEKSKSSMRCEPEASHEILGRRYHGSFMHLSEVQRESTKQAYPA